MADKINFRATPTSQDVREDVIENERRFRASLEDAFAVVDIVLGNISARIGETANTYYIRVTDDAGDGTLAGDANATDYTGQESTVDTCIDVVDNASVYYFVHKDQLYIFTGSRPRRFGAGCPDTVVDGDFTPFGGLVDWGDIANNPFNPDAPEDYHEYARKNASFVRNGVENHSDQAAYVFDDLVAYEGTIYHCIQDHGPQPFSLTNWSPIANVTSSGVSFIYRWSTSTTGDPGSGRFAITDPIANPTNTVRVSGTTDLNNDVSIFWGNVEAGDIVLFIEDTGGAESGIWVATAPSTDAGGYYTIPVNWINNTGEPENNRRGVVSLVGDPSARLPAGGLTDQFLRKASDDNYDTIWHTLVEADITDFDRVRWRGNWVQQEYPKNDMVIGDGAWLLIANKQTSDIAPPRPDGNPVWSAPDIPTWDTPDPAYSGVVESGMEYATTVPIELTGYQIWVPTLSANTNYVIRTYAYPTDDPSQIVFEEIGEPLLIEDDWTTVAVSRKIVSAGTTFGILINALNSGSNTTVGPFDWVRQANDNNAAPTTGNWNRNNSGTLLRINKTDNDAQDRTGDLTGVIAGSTVSIVQKNDATRSVTYRTTTGEADGGAHFEWGIELSDTGVAGEPAVGEATVITITVPLPSPTDYVQWTGGVTAVGFPQKGRLTLGGFEQPAQDDNIFGVRVLAEAYVVSPDWDIAGYVALGGGGSGGGGGGASTFAELSDTPASYAGQADKIVTVKADETGLEFSDSAGGGGSDETFVGQIGMFPLSAVPMGWLVCDGSAFDGATYPLLEAYLGGTTLPDMEDRFVKGSAAAPGVLGGEKTVALSVSNLPAHTHGPGTLSATSSGSAHAHNMRYGNAVTASGGSGNTLRGTGSVQTATDGAHTHSITGNTASQGADEPHNNEPQFFTVVYAIRALPATGGGSSALEFHDPTGVASWQIIGKTLRIWGQYRGTGNNPITRGFPKTFARNPNVIATIAGGSERTVVCASRSTTNATFNRYNTVNDQPTTTDFDWEAIGEWDGIS